MNQPGQGDGQVGPVALVPNTRAGFTYQEEGEQVPSHPQAGLEGEGESEGHDKPAAEPVRNGENVLVY